MTKISPSILAADFSNLESEIKAIDKAGADYIHLDVMDGAFVPNITFGAPVIKALRKHSKKPFDTHLMIKKPELHIEDFAKAGSDIITVHQETTTHLDRAIEQIKSFGCKAGVSIVPSTHETTLDYVIEKLDLVLVMTVNPGFGGQKFLKSQLKKIEAIANTIAKNNLKTELEVDGGVSQDTYRDVINAGANVLVAGSYVFSGDYKERIQSLKV